MRFDKLRIVAGLIALALTIYMLFQLTQSDRSNFVSELGGAILSGTIGYLLISPYWENKEKKRIVAELIRKMGSGDNGTARVAVEELRAIGALTDGTLNGRSFYGANLRNANLGLAILINTDFGNAHLENANLLCADLGGANLGSTPKRLRERLDNEGVPYEGAHLEGADLRESYLDGANLILAHLEGANLKMANLKDADLRGAHLEGANLYETELCGTNFDGAFFDDRTIISHGNHYCTPTYIGQWPKQKEVRISKNSKKD